MSASPIDRLQQALSEFEQDAERVDGTIADVMPEDRILMYGIAAVADELRTANLLSLAGIRAMDEFTGREPSALMDMIQKRLGVES